MLLNNITELNVENDIYRGMLSTFKPAAIHRRWNFLFKIALTNNYYYFCVSVWLSEVLQLIWILKQYQLFPIGV